MLVNNHHQNNHLKSTSYLNGISIFTRIFMILTYLVSMMWGSVYKAQASREISVEAQEVTYVDKSQVLDESGEGYTYYLPLILNGTDTTPPILSITGATADGTMMNGDLENGYILETTRISSIDHLIQFAAGTVASEPLEDTYFGLKLIDSTVTPDDLKAYYEVRGVPEPYLTYLKSAADGVNPFVYIKGTTVTLVDAAKHDIQFVDVDMTVPDDFPVGTYTVQGTISDQAGNVSIVTLMLIVIEDSTPPQLTITGATADGLPMPGDLATGFILETSNVSTIDHSIQFAAGTVASEPLEDTYFGLKLIDSTVTPADLKAYYEVRGVPEPYLTYLKSAADGVNPFVYIKGMTVTLVDAAKHDIQFVDVDMTVPDDFPLGTYTVQGEIRDIIGNKTTATLILIVSGDRTEPIMTITGATADGVAMEGDLATGFILETTNDPEKDRLLQFAAGTVTSEALADEYFGLFLTGATADQISELKSYYEAREVPEPYLTYLKSAADGTNPFVYIKGTTVTLVDAAKHDIQFVDVDMTVPDDFPPGTYTVTGMIADLAGNETPVTLILIVTDIAPKAVDDAYNTLKNKSLVVSAPGVLGNDSSPILASDALTVVLVNNIPGSEGSLILNPNGSFAYVPPTNWVGITSFTYKVFDGTNYSNTATVSIEVVETNIAPTDILLDEHTIDENLPVNSIVGTLSALDTIGDTFTYTLIAGDGDTDNTSFNILGDKLRSSAIFDFEVKNVYSIRVQVTDQGGLSYQKTFTITIINVNEAPTAHDQSVETDEDTALSITLTGSDPDGHTLLFAVTAFPTNGTLSGIAPNLIYTPDLDFIGIDSFTFKASDSELVSNLATVTISVKDKTGPELTITGATADGVAMAGNLTDGYELPTTNDPTLDHLIQFAAGTIASETLAAEYFGLYLVDSTVTAAELKQYYIDRGVPSVPDFLGYLQDAADGVNPFVYIKGADITLVDAAKHDLLASDVDMTVPDDFPLGTYTVEGVVRDEAGNETTVTLKLIVTGDRN